VLSHNHVSIRGSRRAKAHFKVESKVKSEPRYLGCYEEIIGAGNIRAPGPCYFNKERTPPGDLLDPSPRIHGGCFGVLGHTSSEALNM
jgi:hypothetical protein